MKTRIQLSFALALAFLVPITHKAFGINRTGDDLLIGGTTKYGAKPKFVTLDSASDSNEVPATGDPRSRVKAMTATERAIEDVVGCAACLGGLLLIVLAFIGVERLVRRVVRTARRRPNRPAKCRCRFCGYDLTGNESGKCPECGTSSSTVCFTAALKRSAFLRRGALSFWERK